ncbi:TetR/AcrR family transcriptional regulator [Streptomyces sp. NPDC002067]
MRKSGTGDSAVSARERLVRSTQELLWERGYVGTSPKAILERAGVGQGSMYHHFDGKAELALAAVERSAEELWASADACLSGPGTAYDRIAAYLLRERQVLRGCPIGRLTQDRDVVGSAELRRPLDALFDRLRARITEVVAEGVRTGELAAGTEPSAIAATVAATVQGGYVLARAADDPAPFDASVQGLLSLLAAQVTTDPAASPTGAAGHRPVR